jgi:hypothetical protein
MTSFRTDVSIARSAFPIGLKTPVLTVGSCFADAIGQRLYEFKFPTLANPFGVTYNPITIHQLLTRSISTERPEPHTFLENNEVFFNYDFHSEVSALTKEELFHKITGTLTAVHHFLKTCKWIMITYGTAWVYLRKETGEIVANCHKLPQSIFDKMLLTEDEIVSSFQKLAGALQTFNPSARIILTLSPVRHLKDTLELNSVSKATIRTACHAMVSKFKNTEYFPAYEIMLDDLRDYRFYRSDMLHPTRQAEDYIWDKFAEKYFDDETVTFLHEWKSIRAALNHKPFHPASSSHQQFLRQTLARVESFRNRVNVDEEVAVLEKQLL